jgi:hypothetical protein
MSDLLLTQGIVFFAVFFLLQVVHPAVAMASSASTETSAARISSRCACRRLRVEVPATAVSGAVDCHCSHCRKFHLAAFTSFLVVPEERIPDVTIQDANEEDEEETGAALRYSDACSAAEEQYPEAKATVIRTSCRHCHSKLYSTFRTNDKDVTLLLNLGPVDCDTIPESLVTQCRTNRRQLITGQAVPWTRAQPRYKENDDDDDNEASEHSMVLKGSCSCGSCRYEISDWNPPTELLHCYCLLCRQLSGGPFMTWMPVYQRNFCWTSGKEKVEAASLSAKVDSEKTFTEDKSPLQLVRTTSFGQRHICQQCGGVLTIVYDEDGDTMIWPVAAGVDDVSALSDEALEYVAHICCGYKQRWYNLPDDGLPRIAEAS